MNCAICEKAHTYVHTYFGLLYTQNVSIFYFLDYRHLLIN